MTSTTQWETTAEIPRDYWGRPKIIPPNGGKPIPYTRCTTFVSALEDTYNLGKWQMRMVARGLSIREDLLLKANSLGPQPEDDEAALKKWKKDLDTIADQAVEAAKASASANLGTALHSLTERIDRGQKVEDVPQLYRKHLKAYQEATTDFRHIHIERFMVHDNLQVGGTPDRLITIGNNPELIVADIKTGGIEYGVGKIAMQMAMYAHSMLYNPVDGSREWPGAIDPERGIIIALNAQTGACELKWINLAAGWEAIQLATQVKTWRARKDLAEPYTPPTPTNGATYLDDNSERQIMRAIGTATDAQELTAIWRKFETVWTPQMTERAKQRKRQLTTT